MKKAFILLVYKDPEQIERLVKRMYHPNFHFYIHVDLKFDIHPFIYLEKLPNVFLTKKRFKMLWASYRFIETVTFLMDKLLKENDYAFISTFSGQDYPIKSTQEIYEYYANHVGYSFISIEKLGAPWYNRCKKRYESYHMTYYSFKGTNLLSKMINRFLPKRKFPIYNTIYGGPRATWITLSSEAAKHIVEVMKKETKLRSFGKFTWAPDEFIFPTILLNSPLRNKIIFDSGRYIEWSESKANPEIFTTKDYTKIMNSKKLYARKFDVKVDSEILDKLDNNT